MSSVDLGQITAEVAGEGFPVVMIHGLGGTSNTFQPLMNALAGFRVIRVDLPGAGRSRVPHDDLSIEKFTNAVLSAAKTLGVEKAHFVGHSMGTLICQQIAVEHGACVQSLSLFGALVEPPEAARTGLMARAWLAREQGMEPIAEQIINATVSAETKATRPAAIAFVRETIMRQDPLGYAKHCEALSKFQAVDHKRIKAPTLLVTGDSDVVAPPSMAQLIGDRVAGASMHLLDRCGHWATVEKPAECSEKIANFLRRV
ncbi:alpha/beta fold hydrolase [Ferrovibrio sp.]|uniref:alpha/beta fold hydrolase n=1 Tax=Ferrovibrio sp. TaxID=1917215 RepID=UPI0035AF5DB8